MFFEILGVVGISIYIVSTIFQAFKVVKTKNASSYSYISLGLWLFAGLCVIIYNLAEHHGYILIAGNSVNLACNTIITFVKLSEAYKRRRKVTYEQLFNKYVRRVK